MSENQVQREVLPGHTPGPWVVANGLQVWKNGLDTVRSPRICTLQNAADPVWRLSASEMQANARLIAAAPALLAACKKINGVLDDKRWDADGVEGGPRAMLEWCISTACSAIYLAEKGAEK